MDKEEKYRQLSRRMEELMAGESDEIAKMANFAALLHREFDFWWTGFYRVIGDRLVLGPFQGPVACTEISRGRGVCGTAWDKGETLIVPDVELFPGHIACSAESRSEIVVPVRHDGMVTAVLDIDSQYLATFDETDKSCIEQLVKLL